MFTLIKYNPNYQLIRGTLLVAQLVEALRYKLEGRGSIADGIFGIFH
jgi:hypothetical protein